MTRIMATERPSPSAAPEALVTRPLYPADRPALVALAARLPLRMVTAGLNLERCEPGFPKAGWWGVFSPDRSTLVGVLFRIANTALFVDSDGGCASAFAALIDLLPNIFGIRGTAEATRNLLPMLRNYTASGWEPSTFMRLPVPPTIGAQALSLARLARTEDLDKLADLYAGAQSMFRPRDNVAERLSSSRVYVAEETGAGARGRFVSSALLNIEGRTAGLIGGVYTRPECRGHGYAAACTAALALDLQRTGQTPYLYYENPVAGRVYRRVGFEAIGDWCVVYLRRRIGEHR